MNFDKNVHQVLKLVVLIGTLVVANQALVPGIPPQVNNIIELVVAVALTLDKTLVKQESEKKTEEAPKVS